MNLISNVRAVLSAGAGLGGGPVGLAGWAAKAVTPADTSVSVKAFIGVGTSIAAAAGTYFLTAGTPEIGSFSAHLQFLGGAVNDWGSAGITALCTGASYALGPSLGSRRSAKAQPPAAQASVSTFKWPGEG